MSTAVIYLRVSTEDQVEHGYSLAAQREECIKKAQEIGVNRIIEFSDPGISGSILERPGLLGALDALKAKQAEYFITLDTSRLSRNVAHQLLLVDEIKRTGAKLVFVNSKFADTPEDRFHLTVLGAVDEYERARLKLRSLLGKKAKARAGGLTHDPKVYGYVFDPQTDTLSISKNEAEVVRMMYLWAKDGLGFVSIARKLNEMGIPAPRGGQWYKMTVKRILTNPTYKGVLYLNQWDTREAKFNKFRKPEEKVKRKRRPKSEWIPVKVPQIIDTALWEAVQERNEQARRFNSGNKKYDYLLSGLLRCGICGATMHGSLTSSKGKKIAYYVCTAKSPGIAGKPRCQSRFCRAENLEEIVWNQVKSWVLNPETLQSELIESASAETIEKLNTEIDLTQKELEAIEGERIRIAKLFQKGFITEEEMETKLREVIKRKEWLQRQLDLLSRQLAQTKLSKNEMAKLKELSAKFRLHIDKISNEHKRELIRILVNQVVVKEGELTIEARIPAEELETGHKHAVVHLALGRN